MKFWGACLLVLAFTGVSNAEVIYRPATLWLAFEGVDAINCIRNLQQISFAARVWREDHGGQFPPGFDVLTNPPVPLRCPANHAASGLDYEWVPGFDPNNEQSAFIQCRIHGNVARLNGLAERLFNFRDGWPVVDAPPMDVFATPGENVRFEVRVASTALGPVQFQWEKVDAQGQGTAIAAALDGAYAIANVSSNDALRYRVRMSNSMGIAVSSTARLTVATNIQNPQTDARTAEVLCVHRLSSIGLAAHIWANDTERLPSSFAEMKLGWPLILYCPWDTNRVPAEEWDDVDYADVSYEFVPPTPDLENEYAPYARCEAHQFILEAGGRVRSRAILRVPRVAAGSFQAAVYGPANYTYVVECSSELNAWVPVATNTTSSVGFSEFQTEAGLGRKFYRARQ